eukprot:1274465-Pyramimonas_sp.AAC.1
MQTLIQSIQSRSAFAVPRARASRGRRARRARSRARRARRREAALAASGRRRFVGLLRRPATGRPRGPLL